MITIIKSWSGDWYWLLDDNYILTAITAEEIGQLLGGN